ncbi:Nucleoid-associated protein VS_0951 [Vibrio chagasii]|nr:Nucleoid-associated protein VS_0951 [Vibrio chagasii]
MSLQIVNMTIHQLAANSQDELTLKLRNEPIGQSDLSESLASQLHKFFQSKPAKGFSFFKEDSESKEQVTALVNQEIDFHAVSVSFAKRFHENLVKYPFAEQGSLVIAQYQSLATDYFMIALIPTGDTLKVEDNMDLSATQHINLNSTSVIARIDLSTMLMEPDSPRYITYRKGAVGKKYGDFFMDMLDAESGLDAKAQNMILMQAVEDFCGESKLDKDESLSLKKQVHDYASDQKRHGEEIEIRVLSEELPHLTEGASFLDFTSAQGYELEEKFPVEANQLKKLTKFVGAGGGININFDGGLLNERVFYDRETDTLTIKGCPPNLRDQLQRNA